MNNIHKIHEDKDIIFACPYCNSIEFIIVPVEEESVGIKKGWRGVVSLQCANEGCCINQFIYMDTNYQQFLEIENNEMP